MLKPLTARIQLAEEARQRYRQTIDAGVSVEDALDRAMWVHVAKQLRSGDILELRAEDNAWYAEVLVTDVKVTATAVHIPTFALLWQTTLATAKKSAAETEGSYTTKFNGPADRFVIIRTSDKAKVEKGLPTKEAADARMAELIAA